MASFSSCMFQLLALIKQYEVALFATLLGTLIALVCLQSLEEAIPTQEPSPTNGSFVNDVLSTPGKMLSSLRGVVRTDSYFKKRKEEAKMDEKFRTVEQTNKNASYFLRAVRKNDVHLLETLRPLIDKSVDIDLALRQAVLSDSLDSVIFLCRKMNANVNSDNGYALRWSVRKGNLRMTEFLMSVGAQMDEHQGYSILQDAILHRYVEIAELLQRHLPPEMFSNPDFPRDKLPSVYERVLCAVQEQHVETIHTLHGGGCRLDFCDNAPWRLAASLPNCIDLVIFFHDIALFDLDMCDNILLLSAIQREDTDMIAYCVDHGATVSDEALIHANLSSNKRVIDLLAKPQRGGANPVTAKPGSHDDTVLSINFEMNEASFLSDVSAFMPTNLSKELDTYSKTPPPSRRKKGYRRRRRSMKESNVFDSPAGKMELTYGVLTRSQRKFLEDRGDLRGGILPTGSLFK